MQSSPGDRVNAAKGGYKPAIAYRLQGGRILHTSHRDQAAGQGRGSGDLARIENGHRNTYNGDE